MLALETRRTDPIGTSGLQFLIDHSLTPDDTVELYQSLAAFTVGFALMGSPLAETQWSGIPQTLAERLCDWRDATFRRTLRAIMKDYGLE